MAVKSKMAKKDEAVFLKQRLAEVEAKLEKSIGENKMLQEEIKSLKTPAPKKKKKKSKK